MFPPHSLVVAFGEVHVAAMQSASPSWWAGFTRCPSSVVGVQAQEQDRASHSAPISGVPTLGQPLNLSSSVLTLIFLKETAVILLAVSV